MFKFLLRFCLTVGPTRLENGELQASWSTGSLYSIVINGISKSNETLFGKCLYVDDVALFCSVKTIAMINRRVQNPIDTLVDNVLRLYA